MSVPVRDDVVRLAHRGLSVREFSRAVGGLLLRAVPAEGTCLMTIDPATMLPTAEYVENGLPAPDLLRMVEIEVREPDYNKWVHLARAESCAASLGAATAGDLDRSLRHREIRRPGGFADELRVLLGPWGELTVFRETGRPHFAAGEVALAAALADPIADGLRRGLLLEGTRDDDTDVGLLLLDPDDTLTLANPAADSWLDALGAGDRTGARLPVVIGAVARQARAVAAGEPAGSARARARTRCGRWLAVRGSVMGATADAPVAVTIERARPAELAPLLVRAFGFTESERRVTELVARGLSTREIAARLRVTTYTVQDHLKSVFTKSGTASRGELVARLFLDHHAARLISSAPVLPRGVTG